MTDAISRSRVLEALESEKGRVMAEKGNDWPFTGEILARAVDTARAFIKDIPGIDAVPVVRCKDCKHWGAGVAGEIDGIKCCKIAGYMVTMSGYCVYGEVKDDD